MSKYYKEHFGKDNQPICGNLYARVLKVTNMESKVTCKYCIKKLGIKQKITIEKKDDYERKALAKINSLKSLLKKKDWEIKRLNAVINELKQKEYIVDASSGVSEWDLGF